jgi:hypothetical protein
LQTFTTVPCEPAVCWVGDLRPGKPPEGKLDGGESNEGAQGFGKVLEVLGETPVASEPGEGALDHPTARQKWTVALPNQIYQDAGGGEVIITPKIAGFLQGTTAPYWFGAIMISTKVLAERRTTGYFWLTGPVVFTDRIDGTNR